MKEIKIINEDGKGEEGGKRMMRAYRVCSGQERGEEIVMRMRDKSKKEKKEKDK